MNRALSKLQPYPFERLAALRQSVAPPNQPAIDLSIGEPKHPAPALIAKALQVNLPKLANYPTTVGTVELRQAIATWLTRRYRLEPGSISPDRHVLPVNGTREALFACAQCIVDPAAADSPLVVMPNPFYQIYEGAALLAGAQPWYVNSLDELGQKPDFFSVPDKIWRRCQLCYICSPGNPGGAVFSLAEFEQLLALADKYDFVIASDECYSELYFDEAKPPIGLLQAATQLERRDFRRCLVFHSLSKRSNVPGLRSGAVSGDPELIRDFLRYRTYHGCAMPLPTQAASEAAWSDEDHVAENRQLYAKKFRGVIETLAPSLPVVQPAGGFYLWPKVPTDDIAFTRALYAATNVSVLPGSFLARTASDGINPGQQRIRIALVASYEDCMEAARRISSFMRTQF